MTVPCAVLMCHAPIVIPEIAGERGAQCARTTAAMREAALRLLSHRPDVIVIISPHAPRARLRFGIVTSAELSGDFARFGFPELGLRVAGAPELAAVVRERAAARGLETFELSGDELDHGTLVPLHFLCEAGWRGATLVLSLPYPNTRSELEMGSAIADSARVLAIRVCVLASGDMSHRLTPDAPAGYHPAARDFDASFRESIAAGELARAIEIDGDLREAAAEDVVDSCAVAAGAVDFAAHGRRVLCYEGPFGVGYLEAVLCEERSEANSIGERENEAEPAGPPRELLAIARQAIANRVHGTDAALPQLPCAWEGSHGVFVTLRGADGALRGCIGHLEPACAALADEVAACAEAAATRDRRFPPLAAHELDCVRIEISLLSTPEPVADLADLDPNRYGVVVASGERRGVLLPNIDGVRDAREQVRIAAAKAGLNRDAEVTLQRFTVIKLAEAHDPQPFGDRGARELN